MHSLSKPASALKAWLIFLAALYAHPSVFQTVPCESREVGDIPNFPSGRQKAPSTPFLSGWFLFVCLFVSLSLQTVW